MKTVKFTEADGTERVFNPRFITNAKILTSDYNSDWFMTLLFTKDSGLSSYTRKFKTKEEAQQMLECVKLCLDD